MYILKNQCFLSPNFNKKMNYQLLNTNKFTAKQMYTKNKKKFKFLDIKFGNILIFSPLILHGNTVIKLTRPDFR